MSNADETWGMQTLDKEGVAPEWVEKMTMPVIKAVTRIAREHAQQGTILGVKQKPSLASPRCGFSLECFSPKNMILSDLS